MVESFQYATFPQTVLFGAGALVKIARVLAEHRWSRALLVTTPSQRANGTVARVETLLGEKLVAVFDATRSHVPQSTVDAAVQLAHENAADVFIALGGGSAIGAAKAASHALEIPNVAVPTTYAGSEMTPVYGVTRERDGVMKKETVNNPRIVPRVVLYDPQLTLDLPPELSASTGSNAFAHCVEAVYSITRNPLSSAAALSGASIIYRALPRCVEQGADAEARGEMLQGAYLAGVSLANVTMGLHHGVCHVLGGTLGVAHGIANAIVLPHAIRFNADASAPELAQLARTLGIDAQGDETAARELGTRVALWIRQLHLPARLREANVREQDLALIAQLAVTSKAVQNNPKKISESEMIEFLREMW